MDNKSIGKQLQGNYKNNLSSSKKINNLIKFTNIKTEVKFSDNTRFDFLLLHKLFL